MRNFLKRVLFYISVPKCVMCQEPLDFADEGLCNSCKREYDNHKLRNCSRCAKTLDHCSCTPKYLDSHYVKSLAKVYRYTNTAQDNPWNKLLYSLKQDNRRDVFNFLTDELCLSIQNCYPEVISAKERFIITYVPRRESAKRHYGYDHAEVLSKKLAMKLGIKRIGLLKSKSKKAQKEMHGNDRLKNISFVYKRGSPTSLKGKTVILLDDIVTTGASMGTAASMIRALSPKRILGAAVAIAYKDKYTPFNRVPDNFSNGRFSSRYKRKKKM